MNRLVCKMVPPGAKTLPAPIHLVPGDTLTTTVLMHGNDGLTTEWTSTFETEVEMIIRFDYMEIEEAQGEAVLFTELAHTETEGGRDG